MFLFQSKSKIWSNKTKFSKKPFSFFKRYFLGGFGESNSFPKTRFQTLKTDFLED
jgi:hypothetical protein